MLYPKKVRAMCQTELFEHKDGREIIRLSEEYENQPVWHRIVMHFLTGILLFIILAVLIVLSASEWFFSTYEQVGHVWAAVIVVGVMVIFSIAYSVISERVFRIRYQHQRSMLCGYRAKHRLLERIEQEQDV